MPALPALPPEISYLRHDALFAKHEADDSPAPQDTNVTRCVSLHAVVSARSLAVRCQHHRSGEAVLVRDNTVRPGFVFLTVRGQIVSATEDR